MKRSRLITRRKVLMQSIAAMVAFYVHAPPVSGSALPVASYSLTDAALTLISSKTSASAIGRAYLRKCPQETSEEVLRAELCRGLAAEAIDARVFPQRIAQDFENGNTVMLEGWILSRTEARLCALFLV